MIKVCEIEDEILEDLDQVDLIPELKEEFLSLFDSAKEEDLSKSEFVGLLYDYFEIVESEESFEEYFGRLIEPEDYNNKMESLEIFFL